MTKRKAYSMDYDGEYAWIWYATSMKRAKMKCSKVTGISLKDLVATREPWADKYKKEENIPYIEFYKNGIYVICDECGSYLKRGDHSYISKDGNRFLCDLCYGYFEYAKDSFQKID